jgi:hypothetical protein
MSSGDVTVEREAEGMGYTASHDGADDPMVEELEASADFLRKLKPSAIGARVRKLKAGRGKRRRSGSPAPIVIVGAALLAGMLVARLIDATNDDGD